jgi:hypothetical protein
MTAKEKRQFFMQAQYEKGKREGMEEMKQRLFADEARRQRLARTGALEAATKLANALGQSIEALSRAMQSEAGQL